MSVAPCETHRAQVRPNVVALAAPLGKARQRLAGGDDLADISLRPRFAPVIGDVEAMPGKRARREDDRVGLHQGFGLARRSRLCAAVTKLAAGAAGFATAAE